MFRHSRGKPTRHTRSLPYLSPTRPSAFLCFGPMGSGFCHTP
jgi:hypothetical protein